MAQEMPNNMFAGCNVRADGTIVSRTSAIGSVAHPGVGVYTLTLLEGIGDAECAYGTCPDGLDVSQTVRKLSNTQFEIRTFGTATEVAADVRWNLAIHRINSQNGS